MRWLACDKGVVLLALAFLGETVRAEREPTTPGFVAVGMAVTPQYDGSDEHRAVPLLLAERRKGHRYVLLEGLSARANLVNAPTLEAGPVIAYAFGRDQQIDDDVVRRLAPVDDAVDVGAFVARAWRGIGRPGDALRIALQGLADAAGTHGGWTARPSASYSVPIGQRLFVRLDLSATYGSDGYMSTYFEVPAGGAGDPGLSEFDARAGIKDVGLGMLWSYALGRQWSITGFAGGRRLLGDAADSPIVALAGTPNQFTLGLGVGRKF
jgi:outer membrane scaffolding protein for murein synthesis (MipA/OmpV family)